MSDTRPAIRWIDYMGDRDDMHRTNIIGPYEDVEARNTDLRRLAALPLGDRRFNGGQQFFAATMAEAVGEPVWQLKVAEPAQVAAATNQRRFHALFAGYNPEPDPDDDDWVEPTVDPYEPHPDQIALFR